MNTSNYTTARSAKSCELAFRVTVSVTTEPSTGSAFNVSCHLHYLLKNFIYFVSCIRIPNLRKKN